MQNASQRALLLSSYGKESFAHVLSQSATGLAVVFGIAVFGVNSDYDEVRTASRREASKGLVVVEQASIAHKREIYDLRKLAYDARAQLLMPQLSR